MSIQAIIFDLDNTLTHRDLSVQRYSHYLADHFSSDLAVIDVNKIINIVRRIDCGGYPQKELLTHPSIGASVAYALLHELQWLNPPHLEDLAAFWFAQFGACAVAMPELHSVLAQLKADGYKLAVISNGGHETRLNIIQGLGITHYFDYIVSSGGFGHSKPQPEIFIHTTETLGCRPEQCVYVGDHPINDVQGAKNAGLHAIWIQGFHEAKELIQPNIQHLTEIPFIIQQLNTSFKLY